MIKNTKRNKYTDTYSNYHKYKAKTENEHWYNNAKRDLIKRIMIKYSIHPQRTLDVGAGLGTNIRVLESFSKRVIGIDISKSAVKFSNKIGIKNLIYADALTYNGSKYDFILCSDVLEHVDDLKLIKNLRSLLKKNGKMFVCVPAYNLLWGPRDIVACHKRRYSKKGFIRLIQENKFKIIYLNYWNFFNFFPAILYKIIFEKFIFKLRHKRPNTHIYDIHNVVNFPLFMLMRFENYLTERIKLPFGVDLIALIKKEE